MAWPAKSDGSMHHSASRASLHDEMNANKSSKPAGEKSAPKGDGKPAEKDGSTDVSHMDIGEVVSKHGPAHQVTMHHDHSGKMSTVTTHHGEKGKAHVHHAEMSGEDHVKDAHEHAMTAAGHDGEEKGEGDEEAYGGEETPAEEQAEEVSSGIPGIKS